MFPTVYELNQQHYFLGMFPKVLVFMFVSDKTARNSRKIRNNVGKALVTFGKIELCNILHKNLSTCETKKTIFGAAKLTKQIRCLLKALFIAMLGGFKGHKSSRTPLYAATHKSMGMGFMIIPKILRGLKYNLQTTLKPASF